MPSGVLPLVLYPMHVRLLFLSFLFVSSAVGNQDLAEQIRAAQSSGSYAAAAKLYGQLVASGADTAEIRSNYGIMLHLAGDHRRSLQQLRIALRRNPNSAAANLFAGMAEFDLQEYEAAVPYLKRATELDASRIPPLLALAKDYVALRNFGRANTCYAKATSLDSGSAEAWYGLGVTERAEADELLNRVARNPNAPDALTRKQEADRFLTEAMSALSHAIALEPNAARTHLIMAESLSDAGHFADAVSEYQNALKLDPQLTAARLGLATGYWKERQFDEALPLVKQVLLESPKDPEAHGILADILQHNGDLDGAKTHADLALARNPDLIETRIVLARVYLGRKEPAAALAQLNKVISADPDGSYHFLLARAYREAGDEKSAAAARAEFQRMRRATVSAPSDANAVDVPNPQP